MGQGTGASAEDVRTARGTAPTGMQAALYWGERLLHVENIEAGRRFGRGRGLIDAGCLGGIERHRGERFVRIPEGADLEVRSGERVLSREMLVRDGRLADDEDGSTARLRWDPGEAVVLGGDREVEAGLKLVLREVPLAARVRANIFRERDFSFFKIASVSALIALFVVTTILLPEADAPGFDDAVFKGRPEIVTRLIQPPPAPPPPIAVSQTPAQAQSSDAPRPARTSHRLPSGAGARPAAQDATRVRDHGLLRAMDELGGGGSVFAPGGLSENIGNALSNVGRAGSGAVTDGSGLDGLHARGTGPGGGGPGLSVGAGVGTRRPGHGGAGFELPGAGLGPRVTPPAPERTRVVGGLDREDISRVIKRHQHEIRFCYERSLQQSPGLRGKVAVLFVIAPSGAVSQADISESTLEASEVNSCILQRLRRWRFPEPRGGGVVTVNFPWIFKPAGD